VSVAATLIRQARTDAGLSQAELAAGAGTTQSAIARLERAGSNPTLDTLSDVLAAAGYRVELSSVPERTPVDLAQLRARRALTPGQRLRSFQASQRALDTLVIRARRVEDA
jgi:transcriptional regulator with XRE-family HTH domain